MNTTIHPMIFHGSDAGSASSLSIVRAMSAPANDNAGDSHEVDQPHLSSQQRQRFPQKAAAVFADVVLALLLCAAVAALFAFAAAMEG